MGKNILYKKSVSKDLEKIDHSKQIRILNQIEKELSEHPEKGKRLTGTFDGFFRLRVGDYRVIYCLISAGVLILRIAHRKEVYR